MPPTATISAALIRQRWVNVAREHAYVNDLKTTEGNVMRLAELELLSDRLLDQYLQLRAVP